MSVTVGIDIGGSATKIIGFSDGKISTEPLLIHALDPLASFFGAFGKFITVNRLKLCDIGNVMITGLGAPFVKEPIYGIKTARVDEFLAIGLGGLYMTGLTEALVVSMGTGTAFVRAKGGVVTHMGGSGVGGGTIAGLSALLLNSRDLDHLVEMAETGDLSLVDLTIRDIAAEKMALEDHLTVSNFGKISETAASGDLALGILNMAFQTIGVMSSFLAKTANEKTIVMTGKLSTFGVAKKICDEIGSLHGVRFVAPKNSEFATAAGAALAFIENRGYKVLNDA